MSVVLDITLIRLALGCVIIALLPLFVTASALKKGVQNLKISGETTAQRYTSLSYDGYVDVSHVVDGQLPEIEAGEGGDGFNIDDGEFEGGNNELELADADYSTTRDADDAGGSEENLNEATKDDDSNEKNNAAVSSTWVAQDHANVHGCKIYTRKAAMYCDCSDRRLTSIPTDLPENITMLVLYKNSISSVPNGTFCDPSGSCLYRRLGSLVLAGNNISRLELGSFSCLPSLRYLNLKHNHLRMKNGTFPTGVFANISNLIKLKINRNNKNVTDRNLTYQHEAFGHLTRLKHLYVDGLANNYFGEGFRRMRRLTNLTLSGYTEGFCALGNLSRHTFENLPRLSFLNASDCLIDGKFYEPGALKPLQNLKVLDLSFNVNIGFGGMEKILRDINDTKLTTLFANSIVTRFSTSKTITQNLVENLPRTVSHLEARENCFESVDPKVFDMLPKNLTYLDLGSNRFVFGKYLENLPKLKNLETLKLTSGSFMYNIPRQYPSLPKDGDDFTSRDSDLTRGPLDDAETHGDGDTVHLILRLPPKLKSIEMRVAGLDYILSRLNVDTNNSLMNLSLAYNHFPKAKGPIYGLHNLTYLDLRETSLNYIGPKFFKNFPSLLNLLLASCQLGNYFSTAKDNETIFHDLTNLEYLLLSDNRLTILPEDVFRGLDNLRVLDLSVNQIRGFNMDISHMHQLRRINVSHTELQTLPKSVRDHVDMLIRRNTSLTVDMSCTPIHCDCQNLEFLHWLVDSRAFNGGGFKNYKCLYPDTSYKPVTDGYAEEIKVLEKSCAENYPVFLAVLGGTLAILGFVFAGLIYRFRWKIRYLYYAAYLKVKVKDRTDDKAGAFRYDVFVSYAHNDESFVLSELVPELKTRGLRLHVHGRDFVVGDYIASNIAAAVMESRKTLVVLTKNLLKSQWCSYEIQMATMEAIDTGRQVLVFLFKEPISNEDLGVDLLYHIRQNTYTPYPQTEPQEEDEDIFKGFWDKLARDLNG